MFSPVATAAVLAVCAAVMAALDMITGTTPLHYRKVSTMSQFTLTVTVNGIVAEEDYPTHAAAKWACLEASNELEVSCMGLYRMPSDHPSDAQFDGQVWDIYGVQVGTWSIVDTSAMVPAEIPADVAATAAAFTADLSAELVDVDAESDAEAIAADDVLASVLDGDEPWWDLDTDADILTLTLTEADLDGWADDADFIDQQEFLDAVYSDRYDFTDELA